VINFFEIDFLRVVVHRINRKEPNEDFASVVASDSLAVLDDDTIYTLQERLAEAAERHTKAFDVAINRTGGGTFFGLGSELRSVGDEEFIVVSQKIANLLGFSQTSSNLPGGLAIIIDGRRGDDNHGVVIAIKAEMQDVLECDSSNLRLIKDVVLSPTTKLFKFGMIYRYEEHEKGSELSNVAPPNDEWGAFLFDEQFRVDSKPAEYFFNEFLGFSTDGNGKIQSKRFYDATEKFIYDQAGSIDEKNMLVSALKDEMLNKLERSFTPYDFVEKYLPDSGVQEVYRNKVATFLPEQIIKDTTLLSSKLNTKNIFFPGSVKISGPKSAIENNVELITTREQFDEVMASQDSYTLVKILGKPFEKD